MSGLPCNSKIAAATVAEKEAESVKQQQQKTQS